VRISMVGAREVRIADRAARRGRREGEGARWIFWKVVRSREDGGLSGVTDGGLVGVDGAGGEEARMVGGVAGGVRIRGVAVV
jgi:hypothetical protein